MLQPALSPGDLKMSTAVTCPNGHTWVRSEQQPTCPQCGLFESGSVTPFNESAGWTQLELTQPAVPAPPSTLPAIPGYDLLEVVGAGGMGVVYKARQRALNRVVALKTFHEFGGADQIVRERFIAEANLVAKLQHPNIIQIFDVGEFDHRRFLALEFIDGTSLVQVLNRQPQDAAFAAEVVESLARAMAHAHEHGVLHRDLKPGNVLVPRSGAEADDTSRPDWRRLKIADFGLAKDLGAADGPTQMGDVLGTPSYMAPEQASGVQMKLSPAVDVYALGAILYEMLTGRPPFLGSSPAETVIQVLSQEPVPPRQLRPDCPRDLEVICLKCLEKQPEKRYESAAALADDLHRFRQLQPILARPAGSAERLAKWARRKPTTATLAAGSIVVALALVIGSVFYNLQLQRHNRDLAAAQQRAAASLQIARQTVKDMADIAANDLSEVPQLDPTRRQVLQKALSLQHKLLEQDASNPDTKRDIAEAARFAGELYQMLGDHAAAADHLVRAVRLHRELAEQFPHDPAHRNEWVQDLIRLADLRKFTGAADDAEALYLEADRLSQELVAQHPDNPEFLFHRARLYINYGEIHGDAHRPAQAERTFTLARDWLAGLAELTPAEPKYRERLAGAWINLGVTYSTLGRRRDSITAYRRGGEILARLVDENPRQRSYRWSLAQMYNNYANQLWLADDRAAAALAYHEAHDQMRRLTRDFPGIPEYQHTLAIGLENSGFAMFRAAGIGPDGFWNELRNLDAWGIAQGAMMRVEARTIMQELTAQHPDVPRYASAMAYVAGNQAMWHRNRDEWALALPLFRLAVANITRALQLNPGVRRFQELLRDALWFQAESELHTSRVDEAAAAAQQAAKVLPDDYAYHLYAAQITAQCVGVAASPDKARSYIDVTVQLIRSAAAIRQRQFATMRNAGIVGGAVMPEIARRGWHEARTLRTAKEFSPLLDRPALQDLLRELEK